MDYETVYAKASKTDSAYEVIKRGVEKEVADEVRQFKSDYNEKIKEYNEGKPEGQQKEAITSIYMAPDTKRYYPFGNFAAQVLGFVGSDNQGLAGIEAKYDSYLTGTPGRAIRATNANGEEMPFDYEMYYEAEDGNDILSLLVKSGLCASKSDARRNVQQGGVTANDSKVTDIAKTFTEAELRDGVVLKRGKKNFRKMLLK